MYILKYEYKYSNKNVKRYTEKYFETIKEMEEFIEKSKNYREWKEFKVIKKYECKEI